MAFRVEARLGRGRVVDSFDAVLEVQREKLDVIIKRARPEFRSNPTLQDALLEWGLTQAEVEHPDVVAVLEAGHDQDGVYIIQERVEGATLARLLKTLRNGRRTLNPAYALFITERMAAAVAGLQATPAEYHGDLDPGEVLVGYDGTVKVGDQRLGAMRQVVGLDLDPSSDENDYRGPDVHASGMARDAHALALIVLEMMLGHPVWRAPSMSVGDALRALVDFAPVAQGQPALARQLCALLEPCLHPDAARRPTAFNPIALGISDLIAQHHVRRDPEGLGAFVELVVPPLEDADAPTRMAAAAEAESGFLRVSPDRREAFEAASVVITPEILAQAEAAYNARKRKGSVREPTDQIRSRSLSTSGSSPLPRRGSTLEGRSVPVDLPQAPSSLKAIAAEIPNVAAKARAAMVDSEVAAWWPHITIALSVLLVGWWLMSGDVRTIQLRVTSEPSAASVFVDDELVGQTPLARPLEVAADQIELRFEKTGYEAYQITIGTEEDELRYEAPLKPIGIQ